MNECVMPAPRSSVDDRWINQHSRQVHECKEAEPEVILIGDSIIQKMIYFEKFWNEVSSSHPLNLGIGGDRTQHVLWRILNGSNIITSKRVSGNTNVFISYVNIQVVLLHCGTNNHGNNPQQISDGILKILDELQRLFPSAFVIVWGLLPRGELPNPVCSRNKEVNEILEKNLEGRPQVEFICTGDILRLPDGAISRKDMFDYLHLTEQGYLKTFTPVLKRLKQILDAAN